MITEKTNTAVITTTAPKAKQADFVKTIGKTAYMVRVHFSPTAKETIQDKIIRLLRNEATQSPKL